MKKRKSYAELEPVKKKRILSLERFCHYHNNVKNKKKDCKGLYSCITSLKKKVKEGPDYMCPVWCLVDYQIGKKCSSLAFNRPRVACYSSRKHERNLALNNAKKIHNCTDYFELDLIHHSSQNLYILSVSRFLPQSRVHRKERRLTILPITYSDLPQSESNLKCDLVTHYLSTCFTWVAQ